jgi:predicted helicase
MTKIYHAHLYGSREYKYRYLEEHDVTTVDWQELNPQSPFYLFIPQDTDLLGEYNQGWKITEIMPEFSLGCLTKRDGLVIATDSEMLEEKIRKFLDIKKSDEEATQEFGLKLRDKDMWDATQARKSVKNSEVAEYIKLENYRPFDQKYIFYHANFVARPNRRIMQHLEFSNLALVVVRQLASLPFDHIWVTNSLTDQHIISVRTKEGGVILPLYLYPDTQNQQGNLFVEKSANLSKGFLEAIREKLGYIPNPEAIFYYIYGIFHSPTYRQRYAEFLKIDFPRVPLTSNDQLFRDLGTKGEELVNLHLMKSKKLNKLITKVGGEGDNAVTEVTYQAEEQRVYINKTRYFEGIAPEVWQFKIGGYQVLDKWLKDRKKASRILSFDEVLHYQKIAIALKETMQLMAEIDRLIPGFPIQ